MDRENRERLEQVLSYPEDSAGRLMNPDVVTVRADVTVDVVLRYLRLRGECRTTPTTCSWSAAATSTSAGSPLAPCSPPTPTR